MSKYELIICVVNTGFTDVVMDAARSKGARGGTVVHARGTGNKSFEKKYGIVITPDKEMVFILVDAKLRDDILKAIYESAGLQTNGQGIAFSLPVDNVTGMKILDDVQEQ